MKRIKKSTLVLIVGLIIFFLGAYQNLLYEDAKASEYNVEATVTEVKTHSDSDGDDIYTVYGEYEIDGKVYSNVKLGLYTKQYFVGDTVEIVANPNSPGHKMAEGGIFGVVGLVVTVWAIVMKSKEKKAAKHPSASPQDDKV